MYTANHFIRKAVFKCNKIRVFSLNREQCVFGYCLLRAPIVTVNTGLGTVIHFEGEKHVTQFSPQDDINNNVLKRKVNILLSNVVYYTRLL